MNYQIADAKTRYFNDKQHYLNFLNAWSKAVNSVNAKATKNKLYGNKEPGWLTGAHMLLYALLRGKDVRTAFTPITKESRLRNGAYINHGMYWAYDSLSGLARAWNQEERVATFLAPFNGAIDKEVLFKVIEEMPKIGEIYSNYGKGIKIVETLIATDERDSTALWDIIEEGLK